MIFCYKDTDKQTLHHYIYINIGIMNNIFNIIVPVLMALTVNSNTVVSLLTVMVKEKVCLPALEEERDPEF